MRSISGKHRGPFAAAAIVAVALLALALLSAGQAAGRGGAGEDRARVEIENFAFHPRTLRVRRGTKVVFVNRDSVTHTATSSGHFDTKRIRPGGRAVVRLKQPGTYTYFCSIHSFMRGKIVVR